MVSLGNTVEAKLNEWMRVIKITRKPDWEEFSMSAKVTGAGILLIGAIGFAIYFMATVIELASTGAL